MNRSKLKLYLKMAGESTIREFIGEENMDLLIECNFNNDKNITSKENLVNMLIALKGEKIFEDCRIRCEMILHFSDTELEQLCKSMKKEDTDINSLVEDFSKIPWRLSKITKKYLEIFDIDAEEYFKAEDNLYEDAIEEIEPGKISEGNERFYELQDYQFIVKQQTMNRLESKSILKRMLIQMPTGTGKTKTSMHVISNYIINELKNEGIVIWITDRKELLDQAVNSFKNTWEHMGNRKIKIYRLWDNYDFKDDELKDGVIFAGIQKLRSIKKLKSMN